MIAGKIIVAVAMLLALVACSLAAPKYDSEKAAAALKTLPKNTDQDTVERLQVMAMMDELAKSCASISDEDLKKIVETLNANEQVNSYNDAITDACQRVKNMSA